MNGQKETVKGNFNPKAQKSELTGGKTNGFGYLRNSCNGSLMNPKLKKLFLALFLATALAACTGNKKNRCNTCPKWEDSITPQALEGYEK